MKNRRPPKPENRKYEQALTRTDTIALETAREVQYYDDGMGGWRSVIVYAPLSVAAVREFPDAVDAVDADLTPEADVTFGQTGALATRSGPARES